MQKVILTANLVNVKKEQKCFKDAKDLVDKMKEDTTKMLEQVGEKMDDHPFLITLLNA